MSRTCPLCPRPLIGKRKHCPICQAKRRSEKRGFMAKWGRHENSLKNLRRGGTVSDKSKANLKPGSVSKNTALRQKVARLGGKARAEQTQTQMEAAILRKYGKKGLACFKKGKRVGYQAAYYRWKTWAMKAWAGKAA